MDVKFLHSVAVRVMEVWLMSLGFQPSGGWNANDPNCFRDCGTHLIWTVSARMPETITESELDDIWKKFQTYMKEHNALIGSIPFEPYDITVCECPCGCGTFLFVSIYQ